MRALVALFACVLAVLPAEAKAKGPNPLGLWVGRYVCAQGVTALELTITGDPKGKLKAEFSFRAAPENPGVPSGRYSMSGSFDDKSLRLNLHAGKWIEAPDGYMMVDLVGRLSTAGDRYSGGIPMAGCTVFDLRRPDALIS